MAGGHEDIDLLQVAGIRVVLVFIFQRDIAIKIQYNIHAEMLQKQFVGCLLSAGGAPTQLSRLA